MSTGRRSAEWFARAQAVLPGGVSSPVRAFGAVGGRPVVVRSAQGVELTDEDSRPYLDFVGSWGPLILGHADPRVLQAVEAACRRGTSFGAPCVPEIELAEEIVAVYPGIEQIRFVSSGTEAVMSAVRLARAATGRDLIVKFSGCYHGHVDALLVAAGSGLATFGKPSSLGVPESFAALTRVLPLDDTEALTKLFDAEGKHIAAAIIEPVPANHGLLLQRREFLSALLEQCEKHGALSIFDEVITGFRIGAGGAAAHYDLTPDLVTFGKVIGGGMPVGAFAGRRSLMKLLAPQGGVYQAGTLSGNPVAMAAGLTTLKILKEQNGWARLEEKGRYLERVLGEVLRTSPVEATLCRLGSMFWIAWFSKSAPRSAEAIDARAPALYAQIFNTLLRRGIALAPSAYEIGFLSLAHQREHIDRLAEALHAALDSIREAGDFNDTQA